MVRFSEGLGALVPCVYDSCGTCWNFLSLEYLVIREGELTGKLVKKLASATGILSFPAKGGGYSEGRERCRTERGSAGMAKTRRKRPCLPCVILSVAFVVGVIYGVAVALRRLLELV